MKVYVVVGRIGATYGVLAVLTDREQAIEYARRYAIAYTGQEHLLRQEDNFFDPDSGVGDLAISGAYECTVDKTDSIEKRIESWEQFHRLPMGE